MNTDNLRNTYTNLFTENKPNWAVKKISNVNELVHPSIPFIGKEYNDTRILLYASAENLTYYTEQNKALSHLDDDKISIDRHRYCFEHNSKKRFFPYLHIEPVNNGALVVILAYLANRLLNLNNFNTPYDLINKVSIANFGKFSIETQHKNIDYAKSIKRLSYSMPFVKADIEFLKPDIIIIPKTIFNHSKIKDLIKSSVPNAKIIPIYQITPTTINTRIHKDFEIINKDELPKWLVKWHEKIPEYGKITGKTINNYYSVYKYLENILNG